MAAVSENIVREYFELNGFLVKQFRKHVAPAGKEDDDLDFLVINPHVSKAGGAIPLQLESGDLGQVHRGLVVVKPWHSEVFTPALLNNTPELFRFLEKKTFLQALKGFTDGVAPLKILVVPGLPQEKAAREQSLAIMKAHGIDGVLPFRTMLLDLVRQVQANRNYQKSDLLQTLRILKQYDFFREPQLELFKANKPRRNPAPGSAPA